MLISIEEQVPRRVDSRSPFDRYPRRDPVPGVFAGRRVDRDVVDLDPALAEKLLDVAIRQPVTQIPAHGEDDDLRREPEPGEC